MMQRTNNQGQCCNNPVHAPAPVSSRETPPPGRSFASTCFPVMRASRRCILLSPAPVVHLRTATGPNLKACAPHVSPTGFRTRMRAPPLRYAAPAYMRAVRCRCRIGDKPMNRNPTPDGPKKPDRPEGNMPTRQTAIRNMTIPIEIGIPIVIEIGRSGVWGFRNSPDFESLHDFESAVMRIAGPRRAARPRSGPGMGSGSWESGVVFQASWRR